MKTAFWIIGGILVLALIWLLVKHAMLAKIDPEYQGAAVYNTGVTAAPLPIPINGMIMCHWWGLDGAYHSGPTTGIGCFFRGGARGMHLN